MSNFFLNAFLHSYIEWAFYIIFQCIEESIVLGPNIYYSRIKNKNIFAHRTSTPRTMSYFRKFVWIFIISASELKISNEPFYSWFQKLIELRLKVIVVTRQCVAYKYLVLFINNSSDFFTFFFRLRTYASTYEKKNKMVVKWFYSWKKSFMKKSCAIKVDIMLGDRTRLSTCMSEFKNTTWKNFPANLL